MGVCLLWRRLSSSPPSLLCVSSYAFMALCIWFWNAILPLSCACSSRLPASSFTSAYSVSLYLAFSARRVCACGAWMRVKTAAAQTRVKRRLWRRLAYVRKRTAGRRAGCLCCLCRAAAFVTAYHVSSHLPYQQLCKLGAGDIASQVCCLLANA